MPRFADRNAHVPGGSIDRASQQFAVDLTMVVVNGDVGADRNGWISGDRHSCPTYPVEYVRTMSWRRSLQSR